MKSVYKLSSLPWRLVWCRPGQKPDWEESIPASVPGNVLADLHHSGVVPDPFFGENFRGCAWTWEWEFWYRAQLEPGWPVASPDDADSIQLVFEGIDTFAEVSMNAQPLGRVCDMFRQHRFEVRNRFFWKQRNEITVRIDPVLKAGREWMQAHSMENFSPQVALGDPERIPVRKMQMSYGWSNSPRILSGGIFRPVRMECRKQIWLDHVTWKVDEIDLEQKKAKLTVQGTIEGGALEADSYIQAEGRCGESSFLGESRLGSKGVWSVSIEASNCSFWWPNGMGVPYLYNTDVRLVGPGNKILDTQSLWIGIRTVHVKTGPPQKKLVQDRVGDTSLMPGPEPGRWKKIALERPREENVYPFEFFVNGRRVFIKGANWQPLDVLSGRVSNEKIDRAINLCAESHMNLLRVWGGGSIESDYFYEECSRKGILVWQDFCFASAQYPVKSDSPFIKEVKSELMDIIQRLRNHTCLGVWCGDSECDLFVYERDKEPGENLISHQLLPQLLSEWDAQKRYYHPSCPGGGDPPESDWAGDKRNWGAWYPHQNYRAIREEEGRFISEGGCFSLPGLDTIDRFVPAILKWPATNRAWRVHWGDTDQQELRLWKLTEEIWHFFGTPSNLEETVELSQFAQAWAYKLLIERCRQRKNECGGVLIWKLNESWPCVDAGLADYFLNPKLALSFVREAFQPLSISIAQSPVDYSKELQVWVVNDMDRSFEGEVELEMWTLMPDGKAVPADRFQTNFTIEADSSKLALTKDIPPNLDPASAVFTARFKLAGKEEAFSTYYTLVPKAAYRYFKLISK